MTGLRRVSGRRFFEETAQKLCSFKEFQLADCSLLPCRNNPLYFANPHVTHLVSIDILPILG